MRRTVYWIQCGGCGGDTMSFLSLESPDFLELLGHLGIELLWHPSLSTTSAASHRALREALLSGERTLDLLVVEGAILRGPGGTGMFDSIDGRPKKDLVATLAARAGVVVALGTCASFGGIASEDVEPSGLQFSREVRGGFLGAAFRSRAGLPVVNLPGCPCHPRVLLGVLASHAAGVSIELTDLQTPAEFYRELVHHGCPRNEYHEYRVEEEDFGTKGCMYFHLGCRGPIARGPCNRLAWNTRSSKTRVGVPCFGCTQPDFPAPHPFFRTRNIAGIPLELPEGVDRAHYIAYKGLAAAAAPDRLKRS